MPPKRKNETTGPITSKKRGTKKQLIEDGDYEGQKAPTSRTGRNTLLGNGPAPARSIDLRSETPRGDPGPPISLCNRETSEFELVRLKRKSEDGGFPRFRNGTIYIKIHGLNAKYHYMFDESVLRQESSKFRRMLDEPYEDPCPELAKRIATFSTNPTTAYIEIKQDKKTAHWFLARAPVSKRKVTDLTQEYETEDVANSQKEVAPVQPLQAENNEGTQQPTPPPEKNVILYENPSSKVQNLKAFFSSGGEFQGAQASTTTFFNAEIVQATVPGLTCDNTIITEAAAAQQNILTAPPVHPLQTATQTKVPSEERNQHGNKSLLHQSRPLQGKDTIMTSELDGPKQTSDLSSAGVDIRPDQEKANGVSASELMVNNEVQPHLQVPSSMTEGDSSILNVVDHATQLSSTDTEMRDAGDADSDQVPALLLENTDASVEDNTKLPETYSIEADSELLDRPLRKDAVTLTVLEGQTQTLVFPGENSGTSLEAPMEVEASQGDVVDCSKVAEGIQDSAFSPRPHGPNNVVQATQEPDSPQTKGENGSLKDNGSQDGDMSAGLPNRSGNTGDVEQQQETLIRRAFEVAEIKHHKDNQETSTSQDVGTPTQTIGDNTTTASNGSEMPHNVPSVINVESTAHNAASIEIGPEAAFLVGNAGSSTLGVENVPASPASSGSLWDHEVTPVVSPPGKREVFEECLSVKVQKDGISSKEPGEIRVVMFGQGPHAYLEINKVLPDKTLKPLFLEVISGKSFYYMPGTTLTIRAAEGNTDRLDAFWKVFFPSESKSKAKALYEQVGFFKNRHTEYDASCRSTVENGQKEKSPMNKPNNGRMSGEDKVVSSAMRTSQYNSAPTITRVVKRVGRLESPADGPAPPIETCEAFNNLFLLMHNKTPDFGFLGQEHTVEQIRLVADFAAEYECLKNMRSYLTCELVNCGRELYLEIQNDPPKWLKAADQLRSTAIYKEAMIHMIGVYPDNPWKTSSSVLPEHVLSVIKSKAEELDVLQGQVKSGLIFQDVSVNADPSKSWQTEAIEGYWRQWLVQSLNDLEPKRKAATVYRALAVGGDAYLPVVEVYNKLCELRSSNEELNIMQLNQDINQLKSQAQERVQRLVENNSMFDVRAANIDYFTCVRINDSDILWESEVKRLLLKQ